MSAWINHTQTTRYIGGTQVPVPNSNWIGAGQGNFVLNFQQCRTEGIGPWLGVRTKWLVVKNLFLHASGSTSLIFSKQKALNRDNFSAIAASRVLVKLTEKNLVPMFGLSLGVSNAFIFKNQSQLSLAIDYETNYYSGSRLNITFNRGKFPDQADIYTNISLYGFCFNICYEF